MHSPSASRRTGRAAAPEPPLTPPVMRNRHGRADASGTAGGRASNAPFLRPIGRTRRSSASRSCPQAIRPEGGRVARGGPRPSGAMGRPLVHPDDDGHVTPPRPPAAKRRGHTMVARRVTPLDPEAPDSCHAAEPPACHRRPPRHGSWGGAASAADRCCRSPPSVRTHEPRRRGGHMANDGSRPQGFGAWTGCGHVATPQPAGHDRRPGRHFGLPVPGRS